MEFSIFIGIILVFFIILNIVGTIMNPFIKTYNDYECGFCNYCDDVCEERGSDLDRCAFNQIIPACYCKDGYYFNDSMEALT